jgi:MinD-like ATPase involved in chromosome partitioning or flagellar assembly
MPMMKRQRGPAPIRVAVAAPFPEIVRLHESTAEYADELEVCAMITNAESVLSHAQRLQPDVLLLSEELGPTRQDTLARLGTLAPSTRLIMLVADVGAAAVPIADGVVRLDARGAELRAAIMTATGRAPDNQGPPAHSRPATPARPVPVPPQGLDGGHEDSPPPADMGAERRDPCRIVVAFSGKGGVGTSIVATNLATVLSIRGARVAVVDLDLQFGDVAMLLALEAHPVTIEALAQGLDVAALEAALATSRDGVRALLAPTSPEASDLVTVAAVENIVTLLSSTHDFVVVDSPALLEERIVRVMEMADQVLLVSSPGVTSVKDAKVTLRLLQSLGFEPDRVALVLNQSQPGPRLAAGDIQRALHFPVLGSLPFEPRMEAALESGRPLVAGERRSSFSKQIGLIADHLGRGGEPRSTVSGARHAARWRLRLRH